MKQKEFLIVVHKCLWGNRAGQEYTCGEDSYTFLLYYVHLTILDLFIDV